MRFERVVAVAAATLAMVVSASAQTTVFVNEIHYDNDGTDTGEAIEIAGPAGTDLTGWSLVLYNGNGGAPYDTDALTGTIPNLCSGFGVVVVNYPTNGIQNGSPDGLALVDSGGTVVQFLSYEGSFTAVGGPADGMTSTDIGVSEPFTTPVGQSLQLTGTGTVYSDFTWNAPATSSFGACNAGQTFLGTTTEPIINEFVASHTGTDDHEYVEFAGDPSTDYSVYTVLEIEGDAGGTGVVEGAWTVGTTDASGYSTTGFLTANSLENGTMTLLLVEGFSSTPGTDLDTDDDGTFDVTPWTAIVDGVAVNDGGAGDLTYASTELTAYYDGLEFTPGGASRIPDRTDTDTAADWTRNDFDLAGITGYAGSPVYGEAYNTPGAVNEAVPQPVADLVINEIDYDQPSTDAAEFIEIYNADSAAADLDGYSIRLVNGSNTSVYATIDLPDVSLAAGDYFVVCSNAATVPNCDLDVSPDTNLIQNGAPDAVALVNGSTVVDTVSYEGDTGAPYTEGSGAGLADSGSVPFVGISRYPDGTDTDVNNVDFSLRCITPGTANTDSAGDCPDPAAFLAVLINEVDADTPGTDAAEFVELFDGGTGDVPLDGLVVVFFNGSSDTSYAAFDLDGYSTDANGYFVLGNAAVSPDLTFGDNSLQNGADAVALYRADGTDFPSGTAVTTVNLQDAIVYDTSDADDAGLLVLLNPGEPQVNENADGAGSTESDQRCPNGSGGQRNTSSYTQEQPTPGSVNYCVTGTYEIHDIQGAGLASPLDGQVVLTLDNIVTAVGPEGFFIQTPDARVDGDPATSQGLYVYTDDPPTVAVGDQVDVWGEIDEFFGLTEMVGMPTVSVDSSGNPLPTAVAFDTGTPSPDPTAPSCGAIGTAAESNFECFEGMRVTVLTAVATGPSQYFGTDPTAEAFLVAGPDRTYREEGIVYPGLAGLPVWDGNPEVFELDPNWLLASNQAIPAGSSVMAEGVIGFEFNDYELWPTEVTVVPAVLPAPVRPRAAGEFTVGSLNCLRLFDDVDDPGTEDNGAIASTADYTRHLLKLSQYVRLVLDAPDILGVQEVEHLGALTDLADRIHTDDPALSYTPYLVEGNDVGGIDVGFLVRDTVAVDAVTQLGAAELLTYDSSLLHDRPPLLLEGRYTGNGVPFAVKVMVIHNRSFLGIDDPTDGPRVRQKRFEQAQSIAAMVQGLQDTDPGVRLVVVGDFNAYEITDGYVDVTGQIKGQVVPADNLLSGPDLVDPDLVDEVLNLPGVQRYSYTFDGSAQVLDHALTSFGIADFVRGMQYGRGNADAPEALEYDDATPQRASDHDGLVLYVMSDADGNGSPDDAPQFVLLGDANAAAHGTVTDASGISSLVLTTGSFNVTLTPSGSPGDTSWSWVVRLIDPTQPGTGVLLATDADGRTATFAVSPASVLAIPAATPAGLALLATLLAAAGVFLVRRRW